MDSLCLFLCIDYAWKVRFLFMSSGNFTIYRCLKWTRTWIRLSTVVWHASRSNVLALIISKFECYVKMFFINNALLNWWFSYAWPCTHSYHGVGSAHGAYSGTFNVNDTCDSVHLLKTRKIYLTQTSHHHRAVIVSAGASASAILHVLMDCHSAHTCNHCFKLLSFVIQQANTFLDECFSNICSMHISCSYLTIQQFYGCIITSVASTMFYHSLQLTVGGSLGIQNTCICERWFI